MQRKCNLVISFATVACLSLLRAGVSADETVTWENRFETPVRLKADGKFIDSGKTWGHSGPTIADVDEDGLEDLVVGDYSGFFLVYRNVGTLVQAEYAAGEKMLAGSEVAKVPIY
jgi:hypothetical protein